MFIFCTVKSTQVVSIHRKVETWCQLAEH